MNGLIMNF